MTQRELPWEIHTAAAIFLFNAAIGLVAIVIGSSSNYCHFDAGILGFGIAPGLWARSNGWRICGIVVILVGFGLAVLFLPLVLLAPNAEFFWQVHGLRVHNPSAWMIPFIILYGTLQFAAAIWILWVLWRPSTRDLFKTTPRAQDRFPSPPRT